jgi:hypothetical protein
MSSPLNLHLGCEIEFWANEGTAYPAHPEYYPNQWEVNDFHVINPTLNQNLEQLFNWADELKERSSRGRMDFKAPKNGSGGPVFNGIHLHLQLRGGSKRIDYRMGRAAKHAIAANLSKIVMADLMRYYGMTFRGLTSHHIHGGVRGSEYRYKQKDRFQPVVYHQAFDTYELRCIEPEMLYEEKGKAALKSLLSRAYNFLMGKNVVVKPKWRDILTKLHQLPGDFINHSHIVQFKEYTEWLQREGVAVMYGIEIRGGSGSYLVTYQCFDFLKQETVIEERHYEGGFRDDRRPEPRRNMTPLQEQVAQMRRAHASLEAAPSTIPRRPRPVFVSMDGSQQPMETVDPPIGITPIPEAFVEMVNAPQPRRRDSRGRFVSPPPPPVFNISAEQMERVRNMTWTVPSDVTTPTTGDRNEW